MKNGTTEYESLMRDIREKVSKFDICHDGIQFECLADFSCEYLNQDTFHVTGTTLGIISGPVRDSGDYYEPPDWDEYEVEATVSLLVHCSGGGVEDIRLDDIEYDKEPWEQR